MTHDMSCFVFVTGDKPFLAEAKRRPRARHAPLQLSHKASRPSDPPSFSITPYFSPSGCDILWAGVPLLTLPTSTMSGRVAASLLQAALPPSAAATLIARTLDGSLPFSNPSSVTIILTPPSRPHLSDYTDIAAQLLQAISSHHRYWHRHHLNPL